MSLSAPSILAFAGSARRESFNRRFLASAAEEVRAAGGLVDVVELRSFELPLYDGDLEEAQGMPAGALRLVEAIRAHDALLVASPEYNGAFTPLLKNAVDWCSRADDNPFIGRVAVVISASPGPFGGIRSAMQARQMLNKLGCLMTAAQCALPRAHEAFEADGRLKSDHVRASLKEMAAELVRAARALGGRTG